MRLLYPDTVTATATSTPTPTSTTAAMTIVGTFQLIQLFLQYLQRCEIVGLLKFQFPFFLEVSVLLLRCCWLLLLVLCCHDVMGGGSTLRQHLWGLVLENVQWLLMLPYLLLVAIGRRIRPSYRYRW